jgi:hypothetical protein
MYFEVDEKINEDKSNEADKKYENLSRSEKEIYYTEFKRHISQKLIYSGIGVDKCLDILQEISKTIQKSLLKDLLQKIAKEL